MSDEIEDRPAAAKQEVERLADEGERRKLEELNRRRCKLLVVSEEDMLAILRGFTGGHFAQIPHWPELPADVQLQAIHYNYRTLSFEIRLWSASWDPVPPGAAMFLIGPPAYEMVDLQAKQTDSEPL